MTQTLSKVVADFETQLATKISAGGTSGSLVSNVDDDGNTLPNGRYFFTLDKGNSKKEHISCDLSGTSMTNIKSVSRQGVESTGVLREHRVGANVIISDFGHIKFINNLLDGTTNLNSLTPLGYDGAPTISTGNQLTTKTYVDTGLDTKLDDTQIDTDVTLAANSDTKLASQKATKTYADTKLSKAGGIMTGTLTLHTNSPVVDEEAASKGYVDGIAIAGSPDSSTTVKGIVEIATQDQVDAGTDDGETGAKVVIIPSTLQTTITQLENQISYERTLIAGENLSEDDLLYQKESDGKAYRVISTMIQSDMNRIIGFAPSAVTSGDNVTVNSNGVYSGLSGLTAGKTYYIGTTAGSISITDTVAFRAYCVLALSATTCVIVPTTFENIATTASATSPLKFSNDTSIELGSVPSTTYFKVKEILILKPLTNVYVRATGRTTSAGAGAYNTLAIRLYKNGVALGTAVDCGANGSSGTTGDLVTNLAIGDLLQIYAVRTGAYTVGANSFVENFRLYYDVQDAPPYNSSFTSNT